MCALGKSMDKYERVWRGPGGEVHCLGVEYWGLVMLKGIVGHMWLVKEIPVIKKLEKYFLILEEC